MPNWCSTVYVITGEKNELEDFHRVLNELQGNPSRLENDFGSLWLGNLLDYYGFDWEQIECRGSIDEFSLETQDEHLRLYTETAWSAKHKVFEMIFDKYYPSLRFYYSDEELGSEIYETNDVEGVYFPDRYIVDICIEEGGNAHYFKEYYSSLKSAIEGTNELLSLDAPDLPALKQALEDRGIVFSIIEIQVNDENKDG
ncbi:MAG: hypothetical protein ACOX2M_03430 [Fastidiosipilaceae bacterium]|jgi:hypothetical protein